MAILPIPAEERGRDDRTRLIVPFDSSSFNINSVQEYLKFPSSPPSPQRGEGKGEGETKRAYRGLDFGIRVLNNLYEMCH